MTRPICAMTGGTGAIGPIVAAEFEGAGYEVRLLSRASSGSSINGDVTNLDAVRRLVDGADCVVHLAALLHVNNPSPSLYEDYRRINIGGTENVVRAGTEAGAGRIVHFSTINVYGGNQLALLTEDVSPQPDSIYGWTKLESEGVVLSAASGTVLRLAAVYGPRVKGNYRRLLRSLNRRMFINVGSGLNRRTVVYDRDVARAALLAARHASAPGEIFNVTDGQVHTVREITTAMSAALGVPPPRLTLPLAPVRGLAGAIEWSSRVLRMRPVVTRAVIDKYVEDINVSGEKIKTLLGFQPAYDLRRGWQETVALMRESGEL